MDGLVKHLAKSTELSNKQFNEIMAVLSHGSAPLLEDNKRKSSAPKLAFTAFPNVTNKLEFAKAATFTDHTGPLWALEITSDLLISGSSDKTIKVSKRCENT